MCGHENPQGASFCLSCGTASIGYAQTPPPPQGLPATCNACGTSNPPGMKFCRNCGTTLPAPAGAPTAPPLFGGPGGPGGGGFPPGPPPGFSQGPPGPPPGMGLPPPGPLGNPPGGPGAMPFGPPPGGPPPGAPPQGFDGAGFGGPPPGRPGIPPSMMPGGAPGYGADAGYASTLAAPPSAYSGHGNQASGPVPTPPPSANAGIVQCPRCNAQTPGSFAYCQQCGLHLPAVAPTDPGGAVRAGSLGASAAAAVGASVDPQGATMAVPGEAARPMIASLQAQAQAARAPSSAGATWGTAILVNRDGSDGERFPLTGDHVEIGRVGATIAFEQDRFLARSHARIERDGNSARIVCLDVLNGVFRKLELPIDLEDGAVLLVGREVLRFELVEADERDADPLVQHGVALFGSPPRAPWARLSELLPSGALRDIRHLNGEEVVIGREEGELVFRDDAFMSRRHAAINWDGQRARLTDLGSSNGTFVRLSGTSSLRHRDHLRMGDQLFRIELT